jgi:hypothetical protein
MCFPSFPELLDSCQIFKFYVNSSFSLWKGEYRILVSSGVKRGAGLMTETFGSTWFQFSQQGTRVCICKFFY